MSNISDIEDWLSRWIMRYRNNEFEVIEQSEHQWRVIMVNEVSMHKFVTCEAAFAYGMGYIDGCFEHLSEWSDDE